MPDLGLWLDARERQTGLVFVSHAHSDHIAAHREVILTEPTARFLRARVGRVEREQVMAFHERRRMDGGGEPWWLTLLPAGHILGSAMALIEAISMLVSMPTPKPVKPADVLIWM